MCQSLLFRQMKPCDVYCLWAQHFVLSWWQVYKASSEVEECEAGRRGKGHSDGWGVVLIWQAAEQGGGEAPTNP